MKHIKTYEGNINDDYYVALRIPIGMKKSLIIGNMKLWVFKDGQDVQNFILNGINGEIENYGKGQGWPELNLDSFENYEHELDENNRPFFFDVEEAMEWYNDTNKDTEWTYFAMDLESNVQLSDKIQQRLDAEKYNL